MNLQSPAVLETTSYDRSQCKIGIVHLGYGAFHRAHQAVYVDDCMEATNDLRWGIAAVNLRLSESEAFANAAAATDGYLLKTTSPEGAVRYQMVRSHVAFEDWAQESAEAEALLNLETVHAVSVTVTESGYYLDDDWTLNVSDPAIAAEIAGGPPTTVYGYLANALALRAEGIDQRITIMCCDNIRSNGKMLEQNFLKYLRVRKLFNLEKWVEKNATFPCSMVDRITPRSSEILFQEVDTAFPERQLSPIHGESFIQWVLEDKFAGPMPDLAAAGVEVVADVDPFEEAKIRILNGGHTGLCYLAALAGHQTFDQAMRDERIRQHFDGWESENVLPGLAINLPFDRSDYLEQIAARFSNVAIADDLSRICMDGWSKMPIFVRPTLEGCLRQGISPTYGYDCIASWYVYARRFDAGQMPIPYHDPYWDDFKPLLAKGCEADFAGNLQLWADLPRSYEEFVPGIISAIDNMEQAWPA